MPIPGCVLTSDYSFGCDKGAGGIKVFWIIEKDNITSVGETSGNLTAITKASGKVFRRYELVMETSDTVETLTGDQKNGTSFWAQAVKLIINKQQLAVRNELLLMSRTDVIIVAQDNNDTYRLYGRDNGLALLAGTITSGTAWGDRNGYEMNFTGKELESAPFVSSSVISTLQT